MLEFTQSRHLVASFVAGTDSSLANRNYRLMQNSAALPRRTISRKMLAAIRLAAILSVPMLLNGCAALAVSLAGAGAGAGLSHQMNGTATRTFAAPFDKVDNATRVASKRIFLQVDEVSTIDGGQVTKARVSDMDVTLELEVLSPNLTRVSVKARKDLFRVDAATAQEIIVQIEHALSSSELAEAAPPAKSASASDAKYNAPATARKGGAPPKPKSTI
jgi:hypothetical protein